MCSGAVSLRALVVRVLVLVGSRCVWVCVAWCVCEVWCGCVCLFWGVFVGGVLLGGVGFCFFVGAAAAVCETVWVVVSVCCFLCVCVCVRVCVCV